MFDAFLTSPEEIWLPREANRAHAFRIQCFTVFLQHSRVHTWVQCSHYTSRVVVEYQFGIQSVKNADCRLGIKRRFWLALWLLWFCLGFGFQQSFEMALFSMCWMIHLSLSAGNRCVVTYPQTSTSWQTGTSYCGSAWSFSVHTSNTSHTKAASFMNYADVKGCTTFWDSDINMYCPEGGEGILMIN